jgi:intracellular multiplication protein IcmW
MPDLSLEAIHSFWDNYDRRTLYRIIAALENVEHWTQDLDPELEPLVMQLGEVIDEAHSFEVEDESKFVRLLSNIHSGRAMRLLQALDMEKPGTASKLLMFAEETADNTSVLDNTHAKLFIKRNLVFERLQLIARVFAPQRVSLVLKGLEQMRAEIDE